MSGGGRVDADEGRSEISGFFDDFVAAFATFSGERVAILYTVPFVGCHGGGELTCLPTRQAVAASFQDGLDGYRRAGCRACRYSHLAVVPMGRASALGTVTWELLDGRRRTLKRWRESYNLLRVDGGWRVFASTDHIEGRRLGTHET